jgi:phage major head subunit gpT-like protein
MIVNGASLRTLGIAFSAAFNNGLAKAKPQWDRVAMKVPSSTAKQEYGWMREIPQIREWVGERFMANLDNYAYTIANKDFEGSVSVRKNDIEDDNVGLYTPRFQMMGQRVGMFPDVQSFGLLKAGFSTACYDGQNFFDTAHPILDKNGNATTVSNSGGGSGNAWVLLDSSQPVKPVVFQERSPFEMVAMTRPDDERVFTQKELRYGVDGRAGFGFGMWQIAYGSKSALSAANFETAYTALVGRTGDYDVKLGLVPDTLVVGPSNLSAAFALVKAQTYIPAGGTYPVPNPWYGTADVVLSPYFD